MDFQTRFQCVENKSCHVLYVSVIVCTMVSFFTLFLLMYRKGIILTLKKIFHTEKMKKTERCDNTDDDESSDGEEYTMERLLPGSYENDIPYDERIPYQILKRTADLKESPISKQTF